MSRITLIYLISAVVLLGSFATVGAMGFRVMSAFTSTAYVHGMARGVHHK